MAMRTTTTLAMLMAAFARFSQDNKGYMPFVFSRE
jgi:hypothetical protein